MDHLPPPHPTSPSSPDRRRWLALMSGSLALAACGGGGGDEPPRSPPPPVGPSPAVDGPPWRQFGGSAQHAANSTIAAQALGRIAWQAPVDLSPTYSGTGSLLAHYASPLCSAKNTVIVAVKTGSGGGFRIEARAGGNGGLIWQADSDYALPPGYTWLPTWNSALDLQDRLYIPAAGGRLLVRDANAANATMTRALFYNPTAYDAAPAAFNSTVYINTPVTIDAAGNVYFGFVVTGTNPLNLQSGIARIGADGAGTWVSAAVAAGDNTIAKPAANCAPALSPNGRTLYIAVNTARTSGQTQVGYLLALDSETLATKAAVALLEPATSQRASVNDNATSSPAVGPDGDVYYGVLDRSGTAYHNSRGWLLHFDATLATARTPGSFGWDNTPSIVPAALVPSYTGTSTYLLMCKYNNYLGAGSGNGDNKVAILDPFASQADPILPAVSVMREVLTKSGPTPEPGVGLPAVREWCINTCAVDVPGKCILANSSDGYLYRWDLTTNTFSQRISLIPGILEAYTPTAIAADGSVLAIQNAVLYCVKS